MRKVRLLLLTLFVLSALVIKTDVLSKEQAKFKEYIKWDIGYKMPLELKPERKELHLHNRMLEKMADSEVTVTLIIKESLGWYFITAYCPSECGWNGDDDSLIGWYTASGEICHRADWEHRLTEPTTCAISRSIHSFGDLFYIEEFDRVFIAEDTGSAVQGRHLDLFYEDYDDVLSFPTGYYEVFSVEYEEVKVRLEN